MVAQHKLVLKVQLSILIGNEIQILRHGGLSLEELKEKFSTKSN